MPKGLVKWFNSAKGYDFIITEENSQELFAHYTEISMSGYKTLVDGEAVEFDIEQSKKGQQTKNIRRLQPAEEATAVSAALDPTVCELPGAAFGNKSL
jgi:CspA family cold shock protein